MLEPEQRLLLLDALRPPAGFTFDRALGTTFTLDLTALLVTPIAFAMFDVEADDGGIAANPIAVLEAVRRHASRITVFHQAGQMKVPSGFRAAYGYLEGVVVPVRPPGRGGIFHPKIWVIRYVSSGGEVRYRFLCLSRNLTFDRSWDTVLQLDGRPTGSPTEISEPLAEFLTSLPRLAVSALAAPRMATTRELAEEVATVEWESLPDGMHLERFVPLGYDRTARWPFPDRSWRRLIVSPFVEPGFITRFTAAERGDIIVSRPETLDGIGAGPLSHLERRCVLSSDADAEVAAPETTEAPDGEATPSGSGELRGLHAKLFVVDDPWWSRIWTGSANATMAAFEHNVEFLVELRARNTTHGVLSLVTSTSGSTIGFGRLLTDYEPVPEPMDPTEKEQAAQDLDRLAMAFGGLTFAAVVSTESDDRHRLRVTGTGDVETLVDRMGRGLRITIRPLSLGSAAAITPAIGDGEIAAAWDVSFAALTAFFAVELSLADREDIGTHSFLIQAVLSGAPEDRLERILARELRSRSDLVRLVLLLLGGLEPAFGDLVDVISGDRVPTRRNDPLLGSEALLEPLLRTLSRDPSRLDEIERLVGELMRTDEGLALLPEGWVGLWAAVTAARPVHEERA